VATPTQTIVHTRAVLEQFLDSYDRHDLAGVLSTLATSDPRFKYADCDYTGYPSPTLTTRADIVRWLRARFGEGDRFNSIRIVQPNRPDVIGFQGSRISDVLQAQGRSPLEEPTAKMLMTDDGSRMWRLAVDTCVPEAYPPQAGRVRTRVLAVGLMDAYNAHNALRVSQFMSPGVVYWDPLAASSLRGRGKVEGWLRTQFSRGDRYDRFNVSVSPSTPYLARVRATRTVQTGPVSMRVLIRIMFGGFNHDHINRVVISVSTPAACWTARPRGAVSC
jgi:hypothetical protein